MAGDGDVGTIAISTDGLNYTSGLGNGDLKFGSASALKMGIANGRFFIFNSFSTSFHGFDTPNIYQAPTGTWGASPWTTNRRTSATDVTTFPAGLEQMQISATAHSGVGGVYVFADFAGGRIITSPTAMDGSFTLQTLPTTLGLTRIIFFKGKFVGVGYNGAIVNGDATGTTWTVITSGTLEDFEVAEATANTIVIARGGGAILVSSDGTTWEEKSVTGNRQKYLAFLLIE